MNIERYKELHDRYHRSKVTEEEFESELGQSSNKELVELLLSLSSDPYLFRCGSCLEADDHKNCRNPRGEHCCCGD